MDRMSRQYGQRRLRDFLTPETQRVQSADLPNMCDLRIVFLGKNVSENSRVRDSILGIDVHESEELAAFERHNVIPISGRVKDRKVTVLNTLHLLNPNLSDHQITQMVKECVDLSAPGPHAFIVIQQCKDFTEDDMRRVKYVLKKFSEEAIKRTIVLTTDTLMKKHEALHQLIKECGGRHLQLDEGNPEFQSDIFKTVDKILKGNENYYLTCEVYEDVKGMDEEQIRSDHSFRSDKEYEESSQHKVYGKPKERSEVNIRDQSPELHRPNMSLSFSGKQKLNLVLCGSDTTLTVHVSKLLRGLKIKASHHRESSVECVKKEERIHGRAISLVELPALSRLSEEEVMHQTLQCVSLCDPGVHVFLLIIPVGPLTDENKAEIEKIQKIFYSRKHLILLFTSGLTVEFALEFVKSSPSFQSLISSCGGLYRVMGLKESGNSRQIPDLLDYIENIKTTPYSLQMYVKARENRARHELEEQHKKEMSEMESKMKELKEKIQSEGLKCDADDLERLRIVLIGRTGSGKSATGNNILGRDEFESDISTDSVTTVCQKGVGEIDGRSVAVVDTPGLFDTTLTNDHVVEEIVKCVSMSSPGPHVFVIVLSLGRFTREEIDTVDLIKKIFGHKAAQFSIVLFTGGDKLKNKSIHQYVSESKNAELKKLIADCENRFLVFNNTENQDKTQVIHLLNMIEEVKHKNKGRYFTNSMFEEAEMSIKKKMEKIMKEREREILKQREELEAKYQMEMKNMMKKLEEEKQRADEERIRRENEFRKKEENLIKDFEEKEKTEQKKREVENQRQSEEETQQRAEYHQKIEEMMREIEKQKSQYEKQLKEREEEDKKKEEKYRQAQEKMKTEQEQIIADLKTKQEEEIKKRESLKQEKNKEEEEERRRWERKIKEAENDRKETQEEIKRQQREWEYEKKQQMREREVEERKRKEKHEEQLREKQEELEKIRKKIEREREEEKQKLENEIQKQKREREEKEREYTEKKNEMKIHYEQLERERKEQWVRRKQEDDERLEEEKKRWKKMIEDLKREQEEEIRRREKEEMDRKAREKKEQDEMRQKHEEEIKYMRMKHQDEARKQAEEMNDLRERKDELKQSLEQHQKHSELLEKLYEHLKNEKSEEVNHLKMEIENLKKKWCRLM